MDDEWAPEPEGWQLSRRKRILRGVVIGVGVLLFAFACFVLLFLQNTGMFRRHLEISAADIPMYPNAYDISQQAPATGEYPEIYTWTFSSSDVPEAVWQFYDKQMWRRWGFRETSASDSGVRGLIVDSCPFYYLSMSSASIDAAIYRYTIRFAKEPCR